MISVIIPALNEATEVRATIHALRAARGTAVEILLVDGGSTDGTPRIARRMGARAITAGGGRAGAMNAGAACARGEVLLFLHADTRLPQVGLQAVEDAMRDPAVAGGRFGLRLDGVGLRYRIVEAAVAALGWAWRGFTGDRAIFVRRAAFEAMGGFSAVPLFEDVDLSLRLYGQGKVVYTRCAVRTSARRWRRHGCLCTTALMCALLLCYWLGVRPDLLARVYGRYDARDGRGPASLARRAPRRTPGRRQPARGAAPWRAPPTPAPESLDRSPTSSP